MRENKWSEGKGLGSVIIPIDEIANQDEYECDIEVPEENNIDKTILTNEIKLRIQFIKSYFKYYIDLALKVE